MIIAHRGNMNGPSLNENNPEYILKTIEKGYYAEVDVYLHKNGTIYLGHDFPTYKVDLSFFNEKMFVHLKNYSVDKLSHLFFTKNIKFFIQEDNPYAAVYNSEFIWCHSNHPHEGENFILTNLSGSIKGRWTCTDYC